MFSRSYEKHIQHLERVFLKCMKFWISLNPKKSHFSLEEGKLLRLIISKDGIILDPSRVEAIEQIAILGSKKEVLSFIGKVNFLRRFILNCAKIMRSITNMLKKGNETKRTPKEK